METNYLQGHEVTGQDRSPLKTSTTKKLQNFTAIKLGFCGCFIVVLAGLLCGLFGFGFACLFVSNVDLIHATQAHF